MLRPQNASTTEAAGLCRQFHKTTSRGRMRSGGNEAVVLRWSSESV